MSPTAKHVLAALTLAVFLPPAIASAQTNGYWGGGRGVPITIPDAIAQPVAPSPSAGGALIERQDCGASQLQWLLGQHVSVAQDHGISARYFTPDHRVGTMDYVIHRLNISTDDNYIINGIGCG